MTWSKRPGGGGAKDLGDKRPRGEARGQKTTGQKTTGQRT